MNQVINPRETRPGICGAVAGYCLCGLPQHPTSEPHRCDYARCGGAWFGSWFDRSFQVVAFPGGGQSHG